jgi:hypothetical protein
MRSIFALLPAAALAHVLSHQMEPMGPMGGNAVKLETLPSKFNLQGLQRVRMRLGPYTLPAVDDASAPKMPMKDAYGNEGMEDEGGLYDTMADSIQKPCSDCTLKYAKANLEYADGNTANLNTGAWLHHLALSVDGPSKVDLACGTPGTERLLAAHNDRAETFFGTTAEDKFGYYLGSKDTISMKLELKNEAKVPKSVYLALEWEFLPGKVPAGFQNVKTLWLDAAECGTPSSELPAPNDKAFVLESKPWVASTDSDLLFTSGHMHDGGSHVEVYTNDQLACNSTATYGGDPLYVSKGLNEAMDAEDHISSMSYCRGMGHVKKGDKIHLKAVYDLIAHPGLKNLKGKLSGVMGISVMMVTVP